MTNRWARSGGRRRRIAKARNRGQDGACSTETVFSSWHRRSEALNQTINLSVSHLIDRKPSLPPPYPSRLMFAMLLSATTCFRPVQNQHKREGLKLRKTILVYVGIFMAAQSAPAVSGGNIVVGEKVFQRCFSCHSIAEEDPNKKGPSLKGIVGRRIAATTGFSYSAPMTALGASGAKWDEATLDEFLKYPSEFVKGTKMTAPPVRRDTERADLIAFLGAIH